MTFAFIAYPGSPAEIGKEIDATLHSLKESYGRDDVQDWRENDIAGRFIVEPILGHIRESSFLIADITTPNFNVAFEIGYAIGLSKRTLLVRNSLYFKGSSDFSMIGIYDTLGYLKYESSGSLAGSLAEAFGDPTPLPLANRHSLGRPRLFYVEPPERNSYDIAVSSAIKKSRVGFERYDPQEKGRLPARYAIDSVAHADALVARLLPSARNDASVHNLRVAFCFGVAYALGRDYLIFQDTEDPVPLDYRDLVSWVPDPSSVSPKVGELALRLWEFHNETQGKASRVSQETFLSKIDFGSPIAENEGHQLGQYYLATAEFQRALKAEYQVVTGRKGSGKTAFFLELRNSLRRNPNNIILDLQPEGYQLLKFREAALASLAEGSKQHLLTALWEYVLLLETAHRVLREDKDKHLHNHMLLEPFTKLSAFVNKYRVEYDIIGGGDFAERLERILVDVTTRLAREVDDSRNDNVLSYPSITELLHRCDIHELRKLVFDYVEHKQGVWILVDNLDKGWPATGIHRDDLTLVRCLQDALFKLEKPFNKQGLTCRGIVFLRSDVYDRLIEQTPDKGKTLRASLDLSNPDVLREILRRRIAYSVGDQDVELDNVWPRICVSHVSTTGEESFEFLLRRAFMRPRCLIDMARSCQSIAVTLQHEKIEEGDLKDGIESFSIELATNIGLEIKDVYPDAPEIIYELLGSTRRLKKSEVSRVMQKCGLSDEQASEMLDLLLKYGVMGLIDKQGDAQYIYDHRYELRRLLATQAHLADGADAMLEINPAFWSALDIDELTAE